MRYALLLATLLLGILVGALGVIWAQPRGSAPAFAHAPEVRVEVERVVRKRGRARALVSVHNDTGRRIDTVGIECTFLLDGHPVASSGTLLTRIEPGAVATDEVGLYDGAADAARCRLSSLTP